MDLAVASLIVGGVVGIPTDTVYGLAALPCFEHKLFTLKERPADVAVPILVADMKQAATIGELHPLMERWWPGALTVVVRRTDGLGGRTVGVRCPDHAVVRALLREVGPLAVTSANRHGEPPATISRDVRVAFPGIVVIDGGICDGAPSTVVDTTVDPPAVLRQGELSLDDD